MRLTLIAMLLMLAGMPAWAQDADDEVPAAESEVAEDSTDDAAEEPRGDGITSPKTMSGMSILGNEEAPKSLVIIPWKSSRMGDELDLSDTLDDRARPVDKEVFLRELRFHEIRAGGET
jgi:hypothetical protein